MSVDQVEVSMSAINAELARTAVRSLRRAQRATEAAHQDLGIVVSVFPAHDDEGDILIVIDGAIYSELLVWTNDSPRTWRRQIEEAIREGRQKMARLQREPSEN